jgi:hypothetical protein
VRIRFTTIARGVLVTAFFTGLAVLNTYPLAVQADSVIGQHGDAYFSVWRLAWIAHQLVTDPRHLFDANIFYPESNTLAYSDAMLLPGVVLAPLNYAGIPPLVIYNLTLVGALALSGIAAYLLVARLTSSRAAGLVGGVIFAFSPHRFDHFDHLELQFAFWIPLATLAWHRAAVSGRTRDCLLVAACAAGQVLSCIYHGIFLLTWLAGLTAFWHFRRPVRAIRMGTLTLALPVVVLGLYSLPYLANRDRLGDRRPADVAVYSAEASDFLAAPNNSVLYGWTERAGAPERHLFPGFVAIFLVVIGVWPPFDRVRILHVAGLLLALQLVLGFNGFVYRTLYEWVLPFRGMRVPARADILVLAGTAVLAGFGMRRLTTLFKSRRTAATAAALLIGLSAAECLASPAVRDVDDQVSPWYEWLADQRDAVVFEWPVTVPWRLYNMIDVTYMYRSTLHWRPMVNGYSGYYPRSYTALLLAMRPFPDTDSIEYLQQRGVTMLIVHEVTGSRTPYPEAALRLARDPKITIVAEDWDNGRRVLFARLARPAAGP